MFFHGSDVGGLEELRVHGSNHGKFVYLFDEKLRVLPYCVNPVQVYLDKKYGKGKIKAEYRVASSGFKDGVLNLPELYPGFFEDAFKGQTGYIYSFDNPEGVQSLGRPNMFGVPGNLKTECVEIIGDLYDYLFGLEKQGKVSLIRYDNLSLQDRKDLEERHLKAYNHTTNKYAREYLFENFPYIRDAVKNGEISH